MMKAVKRVRLALVYVSLIAISLMFAGTSYAEIDPKTCVGVWLFDEGKGDIAKDYSGKGNDGKLMNDPEWVDGKFGKGLKFDVEAVNYVETRNNIGISENQPRTLMAWIKWSGKGGKRQGIVQFGAVANRQSSTLYLWENGVIGQFKFQTQANDMKSLVLAKTGVWYHFVATWDGTKARIYVDGEEVRSGFLAKLITVDSVVTIGKPFEDTRVFNGLIDDVAIFNVALKEEDIQTIKNKGLEKTLGIITAVDPDPTSVYPTSKLTTIWGSIKAEN